MIKQAGDLSATAYLLSQEQLIKGLEITPEAFSYGAYRTYQVPVRHIEDITGLSFGMLADSDPLSQGRPRYRPVKCCAPTISCCEHLPGKIAW